MSENPIEQIPPLAPIDFFSIFLDVPYEKKLKKIPRLPHFGELLDEEPFAEVGLACSEQGIGVEIDVDQPFAEAFFPNFADGDSVELFFDTRDLKTAGFNTRFCHHFVFLPAAVGGVQKQEITRFRTEDTHPLCDPEELGCQTTFHKKSYTMEIYIPASSLHGYDPAMFQRLGFTYRINRPSYTSQHFSISSRDYAIDQHPALWSSLALTR
jgi:hypothetical protein